MEILGDVTETIRSYTIIELYFKITGFLKVNVFVSFENGPGIHDESVSALRKKINRLNDSRIAFAIDREDDATGVLRALVLP